MSKHTPGPWRCSFDGHGGMRIESIEWQIGYASSAGGRQEANANLMAASPEMLEALKMARDYIAAELAYRKEAYAGYPHKWSTEQEDLQAVDAVISKATGG